ncbi:MAG: DUF11 domain-containing protein, partial [Gemmatimonadetes bacterium]|nr:DUF11 domain-containing protein [Gemmatimonadota bacterium]
TWTCAASGGSACPASGSGNISATVDLLSGGAATFTATGTATGTGTISNTATVTAPGGVNDPAGNNSATDANTVIIASADLSITKTDGVTAVNQGGTVTYSIVVSNAGPSAVTGATVSDVFPAQLTGVTWTCAASGGSACPASGSGDIAASVDLLVGGTATFTATGTVTGTGTISNTATVTAPVGVNDPAGNNSATDGNTVITPTADLSITKTDGVTAVNQGGTVTYTIVVSNAGPSAVTGATVTDVFPAQLTGVTWTCAASGGSACPASGSGNLSASVDLLSGGTATFTATGTVTGTGTLSNTATVAAPGGINDPAGNNSATDGNTVITPTADLAITKTDGVTSVNQGGTVTYTIVVSNAGPSAVTGATVVDNFPLQLSSVTWTCAASAGSACPASGTGDFSASVDLLSGGTATFTATGTATGTGTLSNTATVTAPAGVNDPAGNNSATDGNTVIVATADLAITKTDGVTSVDQGGTVTYVIVVSNAGPSAVTGATVSDVFPAQLTGVTWTCAASAGSACPASGAGNIAATVDLLAGGTATFIASATVTGTGTLSNTATITAPVGINDPAGNNSATDNNTVITPTADLSITKTDGVSAVNQGGTVTYTIVASNAGPSAVTGATVADIFPAQLTGVTWTCAASAGSACPASGSGNINATVDLLSGGSVTFTATGTATGTGTLSNTATVTAPAGVNDPAGNNSATDNNTVITPTADLSITKTDGVTAVVAGGTLTYTIVVSNAGPSAVVGATVTDVFPAQVTGVTWTCAASGGSACPASGAGNIAATVDLLAGGTATFTATGTVTGTGTISNTATVTAPAGINDPAGNNSATDNNTVITAAADLAITKTDGVTSVNQGGTLTYTIVATNAGPSDVVGATVADVLPAQLSGATWTCAAVGGAACTASGSGDINATVDLPAGGTATFTVTATVTGTGTLSNTATITAPVGVVDAPGNNSATDNNTVITPSADLSITKTDGVTSVLQGGTVTYTIVASNAGPSAVTGATVTDVFPAQLTGATWTCAASAGSACPAAGAGNINATVDLLSGGTATFTATATASGSGTISNTATIAAPVGVNDAPGNNSATDNNTVITPTADLSITKTDGVTTVSQGATLTYTIVASNAGPSAVTGATVSDPFPAQLTGVTWTCAASAGSACPASGSGNISATVDLLSGGTATFTATATASGNGLVTNTATITAPAGTNDPAGNNSATDNNTLITAIADLAITKTDGVTTVNQGSTLTYTIVASNAGPNAVVGATVTDAFPAQLSGVTWTCAASAGSACAASGIGNINATVDLLSGGTATFTATATVSGTGTLSNTATIAAPLGVTDPAGNNSATDNNTVVTPTADLSITKTDGVATVNQGGTLTYTIVASNAGPSAVTGATVTDNFPALLGGVTWTCAASAGSACPASGSGDIAASVNLLSGGSATFTATATVIATGSINNTATIAAPAGINDPAGNNSATDVTAVTVTADLAISKTDGVANVNVGSTVTYTIVASNAGPSAVTGATVTDNLPPQLAGATWTCTGAGGAVCPASGAGNIAAVVDLPAGAAATFALTATVASGGTITNTATITAPVGVTDPTPGNNGATDATTVSVPDLAVSKTHSGSFTIGTNALFTIAVQNVGTAPTVGPITVTDTLLTGLSFVSATGTGWSCGAAGAVVTCTLPGPLAPTASSSIALTVGVAAAAAPSVTNRAHVSTASDGNAANDVATDIAAVFPPVDVAIAKVPVGVFRVGGTGTYLLTVTNVGTAPTLGPITVVDTLPTGLRFQSATGTGWTCTENAGVVTCATSSVLAVGAATDITLLVDVDLAALPSVINRATVSTPGDDIAAGNNVVATAPVVVSDAGLSIEKDAGRTTVEIADIVDYRITVRATGTTPVTDAVIDDALPSGFTYVLGSARVDGFPVADPTGAPGPRLSFAIGAVPLGGSVVLTYRVQVGPGAQRGDGINRAVVSSVLTGAVSVQAAAKVRVEGGVFTDRGMIMGKVYLECSCDSTLAVTQGEHEIGIPGVRVLLEDGTAVITDVEGKYSFYGVSPRRHVVRVDRATLPAGARLLETGVRNAGDPVSRFVDLTRGELHVANFAVLRTDPLLEAVRARRNQGEVSGLVRDTAGVGGVRAPGAAAGGAGGAAGAGGSITPAPVAPGAGDGAPMAAPRIDGVYRPLLATGTQLGANSGLPTVLLPTDGAPAAAAGATPPAGRRLEVRLPQSTQPADGLTAVPVVVRLVDGAGALMAWSGPATLEASLGRWEVADLDLAEPGWQVQLTDGTGTFNLIAPTEAAAGEVRVTANGLQGSSAAYFVPAPRPLLANGVVQGRVNLRSISADALSPARDDDGFEAVLRDVAVGGDGSGVQAGARGALYLRGKVRGDYLLTLAFDSERDPDERLMRDIQPDEYYPVYGDASVREFDARSAERLYVRVDKGQSFLMFGDYTTPVSADTRTLSAYSRALTGARQHLEGNRGTLDAFASLGRMTQVVDEFAGQGISGPYQLRRRDGLMNTERVELITRDRNQPRLILRAEPQTRFTDYSLEPFTGRIVFRRPVPSMDANLNPISIRVTYEVEQGGDAYWMGGVTGQARLTDATEVGATVVRDANPLADRTLIGVNATLRLREGTYLLGEMARTDGDSISAGLATRFELRHQGSSLDFRAFMTQSDSAFDNPSSTFGAGRAEYGIRSTLKLDLKTRLRAEALRTEDRVTSGTRDGALLSVERSFSERFRAELGYRYANETAIPASPTTLGATPNATSAIRTRLTGDLLDKRRASVYGEFEQDLAEADQRRAALGADVRVGSRTRLYARHELLSSFAGPYALNGVQQAGNTVIGLDADYLAGQQVFSEYRVRDAFAGRDAEAAIGLRNRWTLAKGFVANTSFERVERVRGTGPEATAVTGGLEYTANPLWRGTARLEFRDATGGDSWLGTLGYARKVSRDVTLLGRTLYSVVAEQETRSRTQFGVAFRQTDTDTWNALARYEFRYEDLQPTGGITSLLQAHIFSGHVNVRLRPDFVLTGQYAAKIATDETDGVETRPNAHLLGLRGLLDIDSRWDAGLITRLLTSGDFGNQEFGLGAEVGRRMATNLRMAVGANLLGFRDDGLAGVSATTRGFYIDFGWKFGEELFGGAPTTAPAAPARAGGAKP